VDRSATYMARYIAKNCVAAGLCDRIEVRLAYVIGRADPTEASVDTFGTEKVNVKKLEAAIRELFPLRPLDMICHLKLRCPIYLPTAAYGHFGRTPGQVSFPGSNARYETFTWEKTDLAAKLAKMFR